MRCPPAELKPCFQKGNMFLRPELLLLLNFANIIIKQASEVEKR